MVALPDLQFGLEVLHLLLQPLKGLCPFAPSVAEAHGGLPGQGGAAAQPPELPGALPVQPCGAHGDAPFLLFDVVVCQSVLPLSKLQTQPISRLTTGQSHGCNTVCYALSCDCLG